MSTRLKKLLRERRLRKIKPDRKMVLKEIKGADQDLSSAMQSLRNKNFKWVTIQAYYSMFHAARAFLYSTGYREKSHRALLMGLKELTEDTGEISAELLRSFGEAMDLREEADYGLEFSEENAHGLIDDAETFLKAIRRILGVKRRT